LGGNGQAHAVASIDSVGRCCWHVDLHLIGTMLGFHAVTLWQNETFHFLYHINIIIQTHFNSPTGKMEAKTTTERV
jgi:hypothetical protein